MPRARRGSHDPCPCVAPVTLTLTGSNCGARARRGRDRQATVSLAVFFSSIPGRAEAVIVVQACSRVVLSRWVSNVRLLILWSSCSQPQLRPDLRADLYQVIAENAPDAVKSGEIKNHFGRKVAIVCGTFRQSFA